GPQEVLDHLAIGRAGELEDGRHVPWIAAHEHDVRRLDRDIRSGTDRNAEVRCDQRWRVVDTVTDHRNGQAARLDLANLLRLWMRQNFCEVFVEPKARGDRFGNLS